MKRRRKRYRRPGDVVDTVVLEIETTPQVVAAIEALVSTGLFGLTVEQAADRLLSRELLREDVAYFWRPAPWPPLPLRRTR